MAGCRSCLPGRDATRGSRCATGGRVRTRGRADVSWLSLSLRPTALTRVGLVSDTVIKFQGLTVAQVSQNQAAVISDPQNHIFVLKNAGFVAYGVAGSYDVLAIVDQTHLPHAIKDHVTGAILGHSFEVRMRSATGPAGSSATDYVVALL
jgi:hypothetical protein